MITYLLYSNPSILTILYYDCRLGTADFGVNPKHVKQFTTALAKVTFKQGTCNSRSP